MTSSKFLTIDGEPISLEQAVHYLQIAGRYQDFLLEILRQHALTKEVRSQELNLPQDYTEQQLTHFRAEYQLTEDDVFQTWLATRGLDSETFFQQYRWALIVKHLKHQIMAAELPLYVQAHQPLLDQVILSWIAVDTKDQILELHHQLKLGFDFEQLAGVYGDSGADACGVEEAFSRKAMPDDLKAAIALAEPGDLTEPLFLDARWYIFRVDALITAELNDELKVQLENDLFEQWLNEKINLMTVKLEVLSSTLSN